MKEKVFEFIKGLPSKYGWKFWAATVCGVLCSFWSFSEGFGKGLIWFIPMFFIGFGNFFLCYWGYYWIFKVLIKTGKAAGKGAVAVGKGAAYVTAAGVAGAVAANRGESISDTIAESRKAVNATKRFFGSDSASADYDESEERRSNRERKKESRQERESTPKRKIMKVWRMEYTGSHDSAPAFLDVPSENQSGRPSGVEIKEALENMGFDSGLASSIANGGSDSCWKVVG